ncbi:erythromycin esterase family protein [Streptomyces lasalocidi]
MTQDIRDFVTPSCDLLALGEPTHQEPAFGRVRNELFAQLVERGFRSVALETARVAALAVNDYVQGGAGSLDTVMQDGFSHGWGALAPNRQLVTWMRDHNRNRPPEERLVFHGFDTPSETYSAPSPRPYLEHARVYLDFDVDLTGLAGDDERWSRAEAVLDPAMSPGATAEAEKLRRVADDMSLSLHTRAPELIDATSRERWLRARTQLTSRPRTAALPPAVRDTAGRLQSPPHRAAGHPGRPDGPEPAGHPGHRGRAGRHPGLREQPPSAAQPGRLARGGPGRGLVGRRARPWRVCSATGTCSSRAPSAAAMPSAWTIRRRTPTRPSSRPASPTGA